MNNNLLQLKIEERLNKLSSKDYDNVECWQKVEAFNKAQVEWVRRQLHGNNIFKEGNDQSSRRIDDLQILLKPLKLKGVTKDIFFETDILPSDYFQFERVSIKGKTNTCPPRSFRVYPAEEANRDDYLADVNSTPSFEWGETFSTLVNNKIRIYTNGQFQVVDPVLIYYRQPKDIQIKGCMNPETGDINSVDQTCEFKRDIIEIIIDEAVSILAGDIESMTQFQRGTQEAERNN